MKIIEALKLQKELLEKASDLRQKIAKHSAKLSFETDVYQNQAQQIRDWLQAHHDLVKEIEKLAVCVSHTNLSTRVTIEIGGRAVTKSITAWILRRKTLASLEQQAYQMLTDRGLKEGAVRPTPDSQPTQVNVVRFYDPKERDDKLSVFTHEPSLIDRKLEVTNAVTDLLEVA